MDHGDFDYLLSTLGEALETCLDRDTNGRIQEAMNFLEKRRKNIGLKLPDQGVELTTKQHREVYFAFYEAGEHEAIKLVMSMTDCDRETARKTLKRYTV